MADDRRVQCSLRNDSSYDFINKDDNKIHGKWETPDGTTSTPPSGVNSGESAWWMVTGRSGGGYGGEATVSYSLTKDSSPMGQICFKFGCPYSADNYAECDVSAPVKYSVYGVKDENVGATSADTEINDYGREGEIPQSDHPLSILYVITDL